MSVGSLTLQINRNYVVDEDVDALAKQLIFITPPMEGEYWLYKVDLDNGQAVVGFPKFTTIAIGFLVEDDWNTNLPYTMDTAEIYEHIKDNAGATSATPVQIMTAIAMIQGTIESTLTKEAQHD